MINVPIFLVLYMHIKPTRLRENGAPNAEFDIKGRLYIGFTCLDQDDSYKIEEAIAVNKNDKNEEDDPQEKNK